MLARRGEIWAVWSGHWISTSRFVPQQTVTNGLSQRGTLASRLALAAARAEHSPASHTPALPATSQAQYRRAARNDQHIYREKSPDLIGTMPCTPCATGASSAARRPPMEDDGRDAIVRSESPTEYFRELVETAMQNQHLAAHELTSFYVVNLLTGFMHVDRRHAHDDEPWASAS